ncbi:1-aminocyclopropane-1-carboxylate oxidase homolog 4-like [Silene latifolia]|uniref:1-aminocyclopropane-1-carboxylate oxidase homolog 4-like n=1 Tax=Silene latifolia TaxID=37657 RepID=UPI003D774262
MTSMINNGQQPTPTEPEYDRRKEAEEFERTKLGVKGLVDSGITRIPRIFQHPPETLFDYQQAVENDHTHLIPVIDMSQTNHNELVDQIRDAATKFGFFQVVNHGVAPSLLRRMITAIKAVHEVSAEEKMGYFRRDIVNTGIGFGFYSNHDLFHSKAASWRDSISVRMGPTPVNPDDIPGVCRNEVMEWEKEVKQLGEQLVGLLSEGLGLSTNRLKGMTYLGRIAMVGQYYPYCPEPNKTVGLSSHTDLGMLTILIQDQVGGLQVKHDNKWINLKSVDGALVVNIGDLFQILSNDKYKSGEHRVYANPWRKPRVAIGTFFSPGSDEDLFGPLEELISPENPILYKQLNFSELLKKFLTRESNSKSMATQFRL